MLLHYNVPLIDGPVKSAKGYISMDKNNAYSDLADDLEQEDTEYELPSDDVRRDLDFDLTPSRMDEHSFEEDFSVELDQAEGREFAEEGDSIALDDEDLELLELDLEYQKWINEGGNNDEC